MARAPRPLPWHVASAALIAAAASYWLDTSAQAVEAPWHAVDEVSASRALAGVPWSPAPVFDLPLLHQEWRGHGGPSHAEGPFGPVTLALSADSGFSGSSRTASVEAPGGARLTCESWSSTNDPTPNRARAATLVYRARRAPPRMQFRCDVTEGPRAPEGDARVLSVASESFSLRALVRTHALPDWLRTDDRAAVRALRISAALLATAALWLVGVAGSALARRAAIRRHPPPSDVGWRARLPLVIAPLLALAALLLLLSA